MEMLTPSTLAEKEVLMATHVVGPVMEERNQENGNNMSSIHQKNDRQPQKRGPRFDSTGNKMSRRRSETSKTIRRLKRHKTEGMSLKEYMKTRPEGAAWLERKQAQR